MLNMVRISCFWVISPGANIITVLRRIPVYHAAENVHAPLHDVRRQLLPEGARCVVSVAGRHMAVPSCAALYGASWLHCQVGSCWGAELQGQHCLRAGYAPGHPVLMYCKETDCMPHPVQITL